MLNNNRKYNSLKKHGAADLLAPPKVPVLVLLLVGEFIADRQITVKKITVILKCKGLQ